MLNEILLTADEILFPPNEILLAGHEPGWALNEILLPPDEILLAASEPLLSPHFSFSIMTDKQINFENMALLVRKHLAETRPQWAAIYPKMLPDFLALDAALGQYGTQAQALTGGGSTGYTDAKDLAEIAVLDAAEPVLRGLKAVQLDAPDPALTRMAAHTRTTLDELRGPEQAKALRELHTLAAARAPALADELVTAAHLTALDAKIKLFVPLLGTPREAINTGSGLRERSVASLGAARKALKKLDVRVPNLLDALPEVVSTYKKARMIVDAGHGPKAAAG